MTTPALKKHTGKQLVPMIKKAFKKKTPKILNKGLTYIYLSYDKKQGRDVWAVCEYTDMGLTTTTRDFSGSFEPSDKYKFSKVRQYRLNRLIGIKYGSPDCGVVFDLDDIKDGTLVFTALRQNALFINSYHHFDKYDDCIGVSALSAS